VALGGSRQRLRKIRLRAKIRQNHNPMRTVLANWLICFALLFVTAENASGAVVVANSAERSLGTRFGHQYADDVLPGGSGTAYAGHGEFVYGSGTVVIPEGTAVTLPRPGIKILDETGRYIEAGDWDGLAMAAQRNPRIANDIEGMATYLPGAEVPNYTLRAPSRLTILQNSATVESRTYLDSLLKPNMGCVQWAACTWYVR
jgi:hypothetical protein